MKKILITAIAIFLTLSIYSQNVKIELREEKPKANYEFTFDMGFMQSLYVHNTYSYSSYNNNNNYFAASFLFSNGVRFPNRLYTGLSTGVEFFTTPIVPILAEIKYDILKNNLSPFLYFRAGGSFALNSNYEEESIYQSNTEEWKGGFIGNWGIGVKKNFKNNTAMSFSLGYRYQKLTKTINYKPEYSVSFEETEYTMNRVVIRAAFSFK